MSDEQVIMDVLNGTSALQHEHKLSPETLRDFFAAAALSGMMSRVMNKDGDAYIPFVEERARVAYENADAMLKAREAKVKA